MSGFKLYFEVHAEPLKELCRAHFAERGRIRLVHHALGKQLGGVGAWHRGDRMSAVAFPKAGGVPEGWKQTDGYSPDMIACVPMRKSAVGKAMAKQLADAPRLPEDRPLLEACGLPREADFVIVDGNRMVSMAAGYVTKPAERFFFVCGREEKATWPYPDGLAEISEATMRLAYAEHNKRAEDEKATGQ